MKNACLTAIYVIGLVVFTDTVLMAGSVNVGGAIDSDTIWTATDTVEVTTDITVNNLASLTIEAGTVVLFLPGITLNVDGILRAEGTAETPVIFNSISEKLGITPMAGDWLGLNYQPGSSGALQYCEISYASNGVNVYIAAPEVTGCTIRNFVNAGIYADGGSASSPIGPTITDCVIEQTKASLKGSGKGIYAFRKALITVSNSRITDCQYGIECYASVGLAPQFDVNDCTIKNSSLFNIYTHAG